MLKFGRHVLSRTVKAWREGILIFGDAEILTIHCQNLWITIRSNTGGSQPVRRYVMMVVLASMLLLYWSIVIVGRVADELLYSEYRNFELKDPIFIISNPRSGTTYLHRLMSQDDTFATPLLYHSLFPSISIMRIIDFSRNYDGRFGRLLNSMLQRFVNLFDHYIFLFWREIHSTSLSRPEEDEALFFVSFASPSLILVCPWICHGQDQIRFFDKQTDHQKELFAAWYKNSLKRISFSLGTTRPLLIKNVFASGRLQWLLECFPKAKIIVPIRDPQQQVASALSMFTGLWPKHSPDVPLDGKLTHDFATLIIQYYAKLLHRARSDPRFVLISYDEMIKEPVLALNAIYTHMGRPLPLEFEARIESLLVAGRAYRSNHVYSLSTYGLDNRTVLELIYDNKI